MTAISDTLSDAWEDDGGASPRLEPAAPTLKGTEAQVEWALRIRRTVNEEFDRVAAAFRVVAHRQTGRRRTETEAIIAILEEKRIGVMSREEAGYFIHDWQEIAAQVRQLILQDSRYRTIRTNWPSR